MLNLSDTVLCQQFQEYRNTPEYQAVFYMSEPRVSVIITTYNACKMLFQHSLKSVLNQTYKNLEIIIVDDNSPDDTEKRIKEIDDLRIKYIKIPERDKSQENWFMTGAYPSNYAIDYCTGDYITFLDDDDYFLSNRIEELVNFNKNARADALHHPFKIFYIQGRILEIDSRHWAAGWVGTSSIFLHGWFKRVKMDLEGKEQGDWNKCRKIMDFGAKIVRYPWTLTLMNQYRHCIEGRNQTLLFQNIDGTKRIKLYDDETLYEGNGWE